MSTTGELKVRFASARDIPRLLRFLPAAMEVPTQATFFVVEKSDGEFRGGAYLMAPRGRRGGRAQFEFACSEEDLDSVGAMLVRALRTEARARGASVLFHSGAVREDGERERFLRSQGFGAVDSISWFEADVEELWLHFEPLYRKLADRGAIPDETSVSPLRHAPITPVIELVRKSIGTRPFILEKLSHSGGLSPELSVVARIGASVEGALLIGEQGGVPKVSFMAIEERSRHGWVFFALEYEVLKRLRDRGYGTVRFQTNPSIDESVVRLARRMRFRDLGRESTYRLALDGTDVPSPDSGESTYVR